jgi:cytochrome P450
VTFRPFWVAPPPVGPPVRVRAEEGGPAWLVTRFADVRQALSDPGLSADTAAPGYPVGPGHRGASTGGSMIRLDGRDHQALRRLFVGEFAPHRLDPALVTAAAELVADRLAAAGPGSDLVPVVAVPMVETVVAGLLGVPPEGRAELAARVRHLHDVTFPHAELDAAERGFLDWLGAALDAADRDDLLGRLAREHVRPGHLSRADAALNLRLIVAASLQTTSSMVALGLLGLLEHADTRRLVADPGALETAVEEVLRHWSVVQTGPRRVAVADTVVGGRPVRAGEGVICSLPAANRDPDGLHRSADSLAGIDVERAGRRHVAFGYGPHQCLGQHLARLELVTLYRVLLTRFPRLRPAVPREELRFRADADIYDVAALPVTW